MTSSNQSPSLPVLPSTKRHRATRQGAALAVLLGGAQPPSRPPSGGHAETGQYSHAGLIALCMVAVALVASLVTFSIVRDHAALRRPMAPIVVPLQP